MKYTIMLAALSGLLLTASAGAEDGHVSHAALGSLGLGDMHALSDAEGMTVRGMSGGGGFAKAWGSSIVSAVLIDPATKSFVVGSDTNGSKSVSTGSNKKGPVAFQTNFSSVEFKLEIETDKSTFNGFLVGGAGGKSTAFGN
jgi:hypothetical protein